MTDKRRSNADPVDDQRGAVMVMGVVMAVFLVAMLYHAVGVGEAILQRQRMQDAADAAAFSAAVVHARGMNVIVLINLVMAALLAVVVALKMVETVCAAAIVLVLVASFFSSGALAGFIPPLRSAQSTARTAAENARKVVFPQLGLLHAAARGVRAMAPIASQARVLDTVVGHYRPPAVAGVAMLPRLALPVQDDGFDVLCEKAAVNVGDLVAYPFEEFGGAVGDLIGGVVSDAIQNLGRSLSGWFCGSGEPSFEKFTITYDEKRPRLASRARCQQYRDDPGGAYDAETHKQICQQAEDEEAESEPDDEGYCRFAGDSDEDDRCQHYWESAERARSACNPGADGKLEDYTWQERKMELYYEKQPTGWVRVLQVVSAERMNGKDVPCDEDEWNPDLGERDAELSHPVCSDYDADECEQPPAPEIDSETGERREAAMGETTEPCHFTEVAQVFGCVKPDVQEEFSTEPGEGDRLTEEQKSSRARYVPQKVEAEVELGGDDFQLRALVVGQPLSALSRASENVMRVATWNRNQRDIRQIYGQARNWGRFSVAQAEYYYAGEEEREQWMWHMKWKARLRRFRLPEGDTAPASDARGNGLDPEVEQWNDARPPVDPEQACQEAVGRGDVQQDQGSACNDVEGSLEFFDSMVVH